MSDSCILRPGNMLKLQSRMQLRRRRSSSRRSVPGLSSASSRSKDLFVWSEESSPSSPRLIWRHESSGQWHIRVGWQRTRRGWCSWMNRNSCYSSQRGPECLGISWTGTRPSICVQNGETWRSKCHGVGVHHFSRCERASSNCQHNGLLCLHRYSQQKASKESVEE